MDRRGNRDEKPTYEELASVLRWIVNVRKNYPNETKEELLKRAIFQAKAIVSELDAVEAKQYKEHVVWTGVKADKYTIYRCDGSNGEQA